jgi:hypothetical protein
VLNEEEEWSRAFKIGATGVMTDFPSKLAEFIRDHPELGVDVGGSVVNDENQCLTSKQPEVDQQIKI